MEDRGGQLTGDFIHIWNHQEQALGGSERGGQGTGLQRTMHGTGSTTFRLQFRHKRNRSVDIGNAAGRPGIGKFTHAGGWGDRVNGNHLTEPVCHICNGFIGINCYLFSDHLTHSIEIV